MHLRPTASAAVTAIARTIARLGMAPNEIIYSRAQQLRPDWAARVDRPTLAAGEIDGPDSFAHAKGRYGSRESDKSASNEAPLAWPLTSLWSAG
jgi:hypothetical protein